MSLAGGAARRTQGSPGGPVEHLEGSGCERGCGRSARARRGSTVPRPCVECLRLCRGCSVAPVARSRACSKRGGAGQHLWEEGSFWEGGSRPPNSVCGAWWAWPLPPNLPLSPRSRHLQTS